MIFVFGLFTGVFLTLLLEALLFYLLKSAVYDTSEDLEQSLSEQEGESCENDF